MFVEAITSTGERVKAINSVEMEDAAKAASSFLRFGRAVGGDGVSTPVCVVGYIVMGDPGEAGTDNDIPIPQVNGARGGKSRREHLPRGSDQRVSSS